MAPPLTFHSHDEGKAPTSELPAKATVSLRRKRERQKGSEG
jgi:hypothetical protein